MLLFLEFYQQNSSIQISIQSHIHFVNYYILLTIFLNYVVGVARFELANEGVKVPCLTAWRHPNKIWIRYGGYQYPVVRLKGFEPLTPALEGRCSIQLSYKRIGAGDENRTHVTSLEG